MEINGVKVIENEDGLFLLKDLFNMSGQPEHKRPSAFLAQKQTKDLLNVFDGAVERNRGRFGGVYASKEIVLAYAMWLSPDFYKKVVTTFLHVAEGRLGEAAIEADTEASRAAAVKFGMAYIEHDRYAFSDKEKAIELFKCVNTPMETFKTRMKNIIRVEFAGALKKNRKPIELIKEVTNISFYKHGITDSSIVVECYNDLIEDGLIRTDGFNVVAL